MAKNVTRSDQPQDRLQRLCAAMSEALEAHPEYREDDRAIIMLDSISEARGGIVTVGYKPGEDPEAAANLIQHVEALFKVNGFNFTFVPMANPPGQG